MGKEEFPPSAPAVQPTPAIYKPINSSQFEIRLLQLEFSMLRTLGQEEPKPLTGRLIHHTLPLGSKTVPRKLISAVTRRAYTALSYVWGDPSLTNEIIIDGHSFPITHALYSALRQLQSDAFGEESIWVDAICINQADDAEKSAQIRNMREVYHNAGNVRVWLGPAYGESDRIYECMSLIQTLTNGFIPDKYKDSHEWWEANLLPLALRPLGFAAHTTLSGWHKINMFSETFVESDTDRKTQLQVLQKQDWEDLYQDYINWRPRTKDLEKFLQLVPDGDLSAVARMIEKYIIVEPEWFSRIWVVQEVCAAWEDIEVCRGPYNMPWDSLLTVIFYLQFTCNIPFPSIEKVMGLEVIRHGFRKGKRRSLYDLMYECRDRRASNPRDQIYGLFGIMGDQIDEFLRPDYSKSVEEVFTHANFHFITQTKSLDPICGQQMLGKRAQLPSWVPDYGLNLGQAPCPLITLEGNDAIFHASGYDERSIYTLHDPDLAFIEWSILHTQGLRIGIIQYASEQAETADTFAEIQRRWRKTLKCSLSEENSLGDAPIDSSLRAIEELTRQYSDYFSAFTVHTADEKPEESSSSTKEKVKGPEVGLQNKSSYSQIDPSNKLISSYLNVLTTGRSTSTTRVLSTTFIPPFPEEAPPLSTRHNQEEYSNLPAVPKRSTSSLLSTLPRAFNATKSPFRRSGSDLSQATTLADESTVQLDPLDNKGKSTDTSLKQQKLLTTCTHLDSCMRRKKFFITSEGTLGSGPEWLREGDVVVVLFGCSVTVILREVDGKVESNEKRWELVGEAFVDGFMDAEALAWLVRGRFKVEDFDLV